MVKRPFTLHSLPVLSEGRYRRFKEQLHAQFLVPWAEMEPTVRRRKWDGPTWTYQRNGRDALASVPLTVWLRDGSQQYWDTYDEVFGPRPSIDIKREHALLEGVAYVVFDRRFRESNAIELANRQTAYFLLCAAARTDLRPVRREVLQALNSGSLSIGQLAKALAHSISVVQAAVLSLWRERRVAVPMADSLMTAQWLVRRLSDVDA